MTRAGLGIAALCTGLLACGSCRNGDAGEALPSSSAAASSSAPGVVAESLPRCRAEAQRLAIPGEDITVGDVAIGTGGLLAGVIRVDGEKRLASVMRASLDLTTSSIVDVGPPLGDDPPPSPRWNGTTAYVAYFARQPSDAGAKLRELRIARLEPSAVGKLEATVLQQADESLAFDIAWNDAGVGLAAWDEDAPTKADAASGPSFEGRGFVKVQVLGSEARRVASPESSDAESPRLVPRPGGGFWLGWLARRAEEEAYAVEGPGEKRAFRWVEVVPLTATGEAAGPVRRITSEKGRVAAFELARNGADLAVMVQDELASAEGAGARIVRYLVAGEKGESIQSSDVVDGGVGTTLAELVPSTSPAEGARWLAWTDTTDRTHMTPLLAAGLVAAAPPTTEPLLDGARVLAAAPPDILYALVGASSESEGTPAQRVRPELRRFACPTEPARQGPGK
ncbi:MAG: hypothetical protein J0I07_24590 [Myxococcales bacterium]|nr:hypothetical protein [Myxococcales bacterium]